MKRNLLAVLALAFVALSCDDPIQPPPPELKVVSVNPKDGEKDAPVTTEVTVTFSGPIDPTTVNLTTFKVMNGDEPVAGSAKTGSPTATFTPTEPLEYSTTYTAMVSGVKNTAGNMLQGEHRWSFTTVRNPSELELLASFAGPVEGLPVNAGGQDGGGAASFAGIAVSAERIAVAANDFLALYTRSGVLTDAQFWDRLFDDLTVDGEGFAAPTIVFDERSGRFFIAAMGGRFQNTDCVVGECVSFYYLAVSKTGSPTKASTADWYVYRFDGTIARTSSGIIQRATFVDDPVVTVHRGHVVMSSHVQRFSDHELLYTELRIVPLEPLLSGITPEDWVDLSDWPHPSTGHQMQRVQPALMLSDHPELFLVSFNDRLSPSGEGKCSFLVWSVDLNSGLPLVRSRPLESDDGWIDCVRITPAPQSGSTSLIYSGDGRVAVRPVFHEGRLWVTRGIGRDFGSGPVVATLWAELDVSGWPGGVRAVQFGLYGEDSRWTAFPSLMIDSKGGAVIAFNRMGADEFASFQVVGRKSVDAPSALRPPLLIQEGTAALNSGSGGPNSFANRTAVARDPIDGSIWALGQYAGHPTLWMTWIANVR